MKIEEILALADIEAKIKALQMRVTTAPVKADIDKQYDPSQHDIMDVTKRPNKSINNENGQLIRTELVARIAVALQKIIVKRAAMFTFGREVKLLGQSIDPNEIAVCDAIKKIWQDTKLNYLNRKLGRCVFAYTEAAEIWFPVQVDNARYGFDSKFKLRCMIVSPALGDTLYPLFDEYNDLIAFSRKFYRTESDVKTEYFETYTADNIIKWTKGDSGYVELSNEPNVVGKIPVVYARQDEVEWVDVQPLIDRLEKLLSNFSDSIDYHASPKIFVVGNITSIGSKGESGAIIQGETGAEASYLTWTQAADAVKLEIETLLKLIYSLTQTPDVSFDSVKGLGNISGVALKLLFMDAHLKVEDKKEIFGEYMQRRVNLLKAFVGILNTQLADASSSVNIEPEITPYMIDDEASYVDMIAVANGNKPVISQKTSIRLANLVDDVDAELTQIQAEEKASNTVDVFGSAV